MSVDAWRDPVEQAVDRALKPLREDALRDVEAILDAALRVAERSTPAEPRVADIVAEAGTSNQAFYRYFSGKDDLMQAVMARGFRRIRDYLDHRMAKAATPAEQIETWIRGVMTQASDERALRQGAAVGDIFAGSHGRLDSEAAEANAALWQLLVPPLAELGSVEPRRDARVIHEAAMGTMTHYVRLRRVPSEQAADHLVGFCLRGITRA